MDKPQGEVRDGKETMENILASLMLSELAKLEILEVKFSSVEMLDYEFDESPFPPWTGIKSIWTPLEAECTARNIDCHIQHPE